MYSSMILPLAPPATHKEISGDLFCLMLSSPVLAMKSLLVSASKLVYFILFLFYSGRFPYQHSMSSPFH